jgi:hypothetical protein
MADLERRLRDLGESLAYPPTPDLARAVRHRLAERRRPWWRRVSRRQALAIGLAVLAVSAAAVMAVPSARTAILRFFHVGAVTVERVETLPPARERPLVAGLGRRVSVAEGERIAGFRMLLPPLKERIERVYARPGVQSVLLGGEDVDSLLLTEIAGSRQLDFAKKFSSPATNVDAVVVNGAFGLWIQGAPHVVAFEDPSGRFQQFTTRLAGNVLVWTRGDLTLRLEGKLTKQRALEIARAVREPAGS